MADTDLVARIYPQGQCRKQESIIEAIETSSRYVPPLVEQAKPRDAYRPGERESTEPPENCDVPEHHFLPCIELRLDDIPRSCHGIVFGADPDSDVVLPNCKGLGYHHFTVTFDDERRPIVKDWGSLVGTEVTYDDEGAGVRSGFQWIVGGHPVPEDIRNIRINLYTKPNIELQMVVASNNMHSPAYIDKVDRFRQGTATAQHLFGDLDIPKRPDTERPTGAHTPGAGKVHLRKTIGEGSFAVVTHFWNVSTGEEHALKQPSRKAIREHRVDVAAWKNEAHIMNLISHPNIVQLFWSDFTLSPWLCLEYIPGGSLTEQENLSIAECVMVLCQCLSALEYLHGSNPPIVHRDIKADNILVEYRDLDRIYVKFGDFGLSKDFDNMSTICGNWLHLAPEVYENQQYIYAGGKKRVSYTAAVDVWSLGVTVYGLLCALPEYKQKDMLRGTVWAEKIVKTFEKDFEERPDELKQFLLEAMVVIPPDERRSAQACHTTVAGLLRIRDEGFFEAPKMGSYAAEDERTMIQRQPEGSIVEVLQTATWQPGSSDRVTVLSAANKHVRQGALAPRPSAPAPSSNRKRPKTVSKTPSSSGRHTKRRDHGSYGVESASSQRLDHLPSNRTQESLPLDERRQDRNAYERNQGGEDSGYVKSPCQTDHLPNSPVDLEIEHSPTDDAQGTQHPQGWSPIQSQPPEQSSPIIGPLPPQTPSKASHLSTRDLLFDCMGQVSMVIRQKAISMSTSDFQLNASQILTAANLHKLEKDKFLRKFQKLCIGVRRQGNTGRPDLWVPFQHGVFLCQAVGLEEELKPLLLYSPLASPNREKNYFLVRHRRALGSGSKNGFAGLWCRDCEIAYHPSKRIINATQLLKAGNISRHKLLGFFKENPEIAKEAIRRGDSRVLGTYISYKDARELCDHFELSLAPVQRFLTGGLASVPPNTFSNEDTHDYTEVAADDREGVGSDAPTLGSPGIDPGALTGPQMPDHDQLVGVPGGVCRKMYSKSNENRSDVAPQCLRFRATLLPPADEDSWVTKRSALSQVHPYLSPPQVQNFSGEWVTD